MNETLTSITLWDNQIGDDGAKYTADALMVTVRHCSLSIGIDKECSTTRNVKCVVDGCIRLVFPAPIRRLQDQKCHPSSQCVCM